MKKPEKTRPQKESISFKLLACYSDNELVSLYQELPDSAIIGELFKRYVHLVAGIAFKFLKDEEKARDTAQEIFARLLKLLDKTKIRNFRNWISVVTKHECLQRLEKDNRLATESLNENILVIADDGTREQLETREAKLNALEFAIAKLPDPQKICIRLFYFKKKSYTQIAEITGFAVKRIKSYLQNGRRKLKLLLLPY